MDITIRKQNNKKAWDVILGIETLKWLQIAGGDINSHLHICSWHNRLWFMTTDRLRLHAIQIKQDIDVPTHTLPLARIIHELAYDKLKGLTLQYSMDPKDEANWGNFEGKVFRIDFIGLDRDYNEMRAFTMEGVASDYCNKIPTLLPDDINLSLSESAFNSAFISSALKGLASAVFLGQQGEKLFVVPECKPQLFDQPWFVMTMAQQPTFRFNDDEEAA